jgi:uncharacterized membrane protein YgdD (TMEM256/DUF423 family)
LDAVNGESAIRFGAALGFIGVALGAFGAHGLKTLLEAKGTLAVWETAVLYQLVHAVALLALGALGRPAAWTARLWLAGVVVFSGSLYLLALTGVKWIGAITPVGGVALLAGWLVLVVKPK